MRAQVVRTRILGTANCSTDPNAVCMDVLIEARLGILDQVAGPRLPSRPVVRYIYHIPAPRGAVGWWLVTDSNPPRPYRPSSPLAPDSANQRQLCFATSALARFGAVPPGGAVRGDNLCYPD